jgi:hypothetical protein
MAVALGFSNPPNTVAPTIDVSYNGETGPFPLKAPFNPPSAFSLKRFGGLCALHKNARQAEISRRHAAHASEVGELQNLGRAYGFEI